jgi:hypothetical protein
MSLEQLCSPASDFQKNWMKINCKELTVDGVSIPQEIPSSQTAFYGAPSISQNLAGAINGNMKLYDFTYQGFDYVSDETLQCNVSGLYQISSVLTLRGNLTTPFPYESSMEVIFRCVNTTTGKQVTCGSASLGPVLTVPLIGLLGFVQGHQLQFKYEFVSVVNIGAIQVLGSSSSYASQIGIYRVADNLVNKSILEEEVEEEEAKLE